MSLRVVQTPESLADIALQADYYARRKDVALAQRFTEAVKTTMRLLASHPGLGKEMDYDHPSPDISPSEQKVSEVRGVNRYG